MKICATILFAVLVVEGNAQTRCANIDTLMKRVYKHELGSQQWRAASDSVLNICPNSAVIIYDKAVANMLRGEFVEGMKYIAKAVEIDPNYYLGISAWNHMRYLHDYKGAIADFERLEKVAGRSFVYVTNIHMYMLKGLCYQELGDYAKALETYNTGISQQVADKGEQWVGSYDYLYRGILKFRMGDFDGAIEDLSRQVKEYESLADTYYYRGMAYAAVGRKDEARVDLQLSKDLMLGQGQRRWDPLTVLPDEVYLTNVESALLKLY
ncbi:MAG: tetratricopeptide repeat protein [Bacteroidota bacterium]